jgi:hypothetical protein
MEGCMVFCGVVGSLSVRILEERHPAFRGVSWTWRDD